MPVVSVNIAHRVQLRNNCLVVLCLLAHEYHSTGLPHIHDNNIMNLYFASYVEQTFTRQDHVRDMHIESTMCTMKT